MAAMVRPLVVWMALCGVAAAEPPSAWRLARVVHAVSPGITQFEVQRLDERGGRVRMIIHPQDITCPGGATYVYSWRIDGETRRITVGQRLLVSFEAQQTAGARCMNAEPIGRAGTSLGGIQTGYPPGSFDTLEVPGYREFYLHPEEHVERHLAQWPATVGKTPMQHLVLAIGFDTSGHSGGQYIRAALLYDLETPGAPPLPPAAPPPAPTSPPIAPPGHMPPPPAAPAGAAIEPGFNRYGADYHSFDARSSRPEECHAACAADPRCRSFTFIRPGLQGPYARCWLKDAVPPAVPDANCVSGVLRPAGGPLLEPGTNRGGGDYRGMELPSGNPAECAAICAREAQCRSFTVVRAGVQGPHARCWLKNVVPPPGPDPNCTSGVVPR